MADDRRATSSAQKGFRIFSGTSSTWQMEPILESIFGDCSTRLANAIYGVRMGRLVASASRVQVTLGVINKAKMERKSLKKHLTLSRPK
jgi:hypothetical protein